MEKNGATVKNRSVNFNKLKINKYMSAKVFIFMIIGFLLSRFTLVDNVAPFGIAFFLCFVKLDKYKLPVFITTLLGILLSFNTFVNMTKYSIALVVVLLLSKKLKNVDSVAKISIIGTLIILPLSLGQAIYSNKNIYDYIIVFMEGALTFISAYIFSYGIKFLINNN